MNISHPRNGWEGAGERWYRKVEHYVSVFDEDIDLDNYVVAGAPFAGAIGEFLMNRFECFVAADGAALWEDSTKLRQFRANKPKPSIDIYSLAGRKIQTILWEKGAIKGLGWSADECLLVATQDGTVRLL